MLGPWLRRALAVDATGFTSAADAQAELDRLLPGVKGAWSRHLLPGAENLAIGGGAAPNERSASPGAAAPRDHPATSQREPHGVTAPQAPLRAPATVRASSSRRGQAARVQVESTAAAAVQVGAATAAQVARLRRIAAVLATVAAVEAAALGVLLVGAPDRWLAATAAASSGAVAADAASRQAPTSSAGVADAGGSGAGQPVSATTAAEPPAWLSLTSEIPVGVYIDGSHVGTAMRGRFRVAAGDHQLTLVNEAAGYRLAQKIRIRAGRTLALRPVLFREATPRQP
jgi:hypothetical protein